MPCWTSSDQYERVRPITPHLSHLQPIHTKNKKYYSLLDISLHRIIISIQYRISTSVIWWALTQITWSPLYEWMKETHGFIYHTHSEARVTLAVTSASAISLNEDIHEQHLLNCSESHFMSILPFDLSKNSIISYTPRTVKVFTATRQNKSLVKLGRHLEDTAEIC